MKIRFLDDINKATRHGQHGIVVYRLYNFYFTVFFYLWDIPVYAHCIGRLGLLIFIPVAVTQIIRGAVAKLEDQAAPIRRVEYYERCICDRSTSRRRILGAFGFFKALIVIRWLSSARKFGMLVKDRNTGTGYEVITLSGYLEYYICCSQRCCLADQHWCFFCRFI